MKTMPIIGTKSSLLWDENSDAWVYLSGRELENTPKSYYKIIPTLYRAVDKRAKAISGLPWTIYKGDTEYDTSDEYENKTGLVKNMTTLLYLVESALCLMGKAYLKREKNPAGYDKIRYIEPTSVSLDLGMASKGELLFKRHDPTTGETREYTQKEIIYLWLPDPNVEIGPPSVSPASSALAACGVLANMDEFARDYFGRGAVKAMLFAMQGVPKSEAEKFESWWNRYISGIKNAFRTKVINAEKIEPVVVGEGIKELENITLGQEKREEIAIAMDVPMSLLFSNAANYATSVQDKKNWYTDFVVPESLFISSVLNDQLYRPLGYHIEFEPESLDIMQEDEAERSAAMNQFITAVNAAGSWEMAQAMLMIYGVEISKEAMKLMEAHYSKKEENAQIMQEQLQGKPDTEDETPEDEPEEEPEEQPINEAQTKELTIWQRKCLNALKRGESAVSIAFVPVSITPEMYNTIATGLKDVNDPDAIKDVFKTATIGGIVAKPEITESGLIALAAELRRANDMLEREE